jgi:hypothetical protein
VRNTFSPEVYQLTLPAETEQDFSEEPSSTSSDDYSSGTEDDYYEAIFLSYYYVFLINK